MSINDIVPEIEAAAREALIAAGALKVCPMHSDVTIRIGDPDAEKHAYARATTILKSKDKMYIREDVMGAIQDELNMAADDECPQCGQLRDS